jgi:hypothetical protein
LQGLEKPAKILDQDRQSLGRDFNPRPPEHEAVLPTDPRPFSLGRRLPVRVLADTELFEFHCELKQLL